MEFNEAELGKRFVLKGGLGQAAKLGGDGEMSKNAIAGGTPWTGGKGGTLKCSEVLYTKLLTRPDLVDDSGGDGGKPDRDRIGGPKDIGQLINILGRAFRINPRPAGKDAPGPQAALSGAGNRQTNAQYPPTDQALSFILEHLDTVAKTNPFQAKSLSHRYYNRTAPWLKGEDGKLSEEYLTDARR